MSATPSPARASSPTPRFTVEPTRMGYGQLAMMALEAHGDELKDVMVFRGTESPAADVGESHQPMSAAPAPTLVDLAPAPTDEEDEMPDLTEGIPETQLKTEPSHISIWRGIDADMIERGELRIGESTVYTGVPTAFDNEDPLDRIAFTHADIRAPSRPMEHDVIRAGAIMEVGRGLGSLSMRRIHMEPTLSAQSGATTVTVLRGFPDPRPDPPARIIDRITCARLRGICAESAERATDPSVAVLSLITIADYPRWAGRRGICTFETLSDLTDFLTFAAAGPLCPRCESGVESRVTPRPMPAEFIHAADEDIALVWRSDGPWYPSMPTRCTVLKQVGHMPRSGIAVIDRAIDAIRAAHATLAV